MGERATAGTDDIEDTVVSVRSDYVRLRGDVDEAREERAHILRSLDRLAGEVRELSTRVGDPPNPLEGYEGSGLQRSIYLGAYRDDVTVPQGRAVRNAVLVSRRKVIAGVVAGVVAIVVAAGQAIAALGGGG